MEAVKTKKNTPGKRGRIIFREFHREHWKGGSNSGEKCGKFKPKRGKREWSQKVHGGSRGKEIEGKQSETARGEKNYDTTPAGKRKGEAKNRGAKRGQSLAPKKKRKHEGEGIEKIKEHTRKSFTSRTQNSQLQKIGVRFEIPGGGDVLFYRNTPFRRLHAKDKRSKGKGRFRNLVAFGFRGKEKERST